jgi:hypothetical protein
VLDSGVTMWGDVAARGSVGNLSGVGAQGGFGVLGVVAARGSVGALGDVDANGGVAAWGGMGALGGIGTRGSVCVLYRRTSGISSSFSSSSSIKLAMTLHHFWLLSSSSIFKWPLVPKGSVDVFFQEGPSDVGPFLATFLVMWRLVSFAPSLLLSLELRAVLR